VFFIVRVIELLLLKVTSVIVIEDDPMKLNVSAPIHAATAMLTATVTAMRIIEATTGLRAFLFLSIFISVLIPPFGVARYVSGVNAFKSYDLLYNICHLYNKNTEARKTGFKA